MLNTKPNLKINRSKSILVIFIFFRKINMFRNNTMTALKETFNVDIRQYACANHHISGILSLHFYFTISHNTLYVGRVQA